MSSSRVDAEIHELDRERARVVLGRVAGCRGGDEIESAGDSCDLDRVDVSPAVRDASGPARELVEPLAIHPQLPEGTGVGHLQVEQQ